MFDSEMFYEYWIYSQRRTDPSIHRVHEESASLESFY